MTDDTGNTQTAEDPGSTAGQETGQPNGAGGETSLLGDLGAAGDNIRPEGLADKYWDGDAAKPRWGDVLKQHNYLETELGKTKQVAGDYFGAPEEGSDYSVELPEGIDADASDPLLTAFKERARAMNLSQKGFEETVEWFFENSGQNEQAEGERVAQELNNLGPNAKARLENINDWAKAQMPPELYQGVSDACTTAAGVEALEYLANRMPTGALPSFSGEGVPVLTEEQIDAERFKKDENGKNLYDTSKDHRQKVQGMYRQAYGDTPRTEYVDFKKG